MPGLPVTRDRRPPARRLLLVETVGGLLVLLVLFAGARLAFAQGGGDECITLDDFRPSKVGEFPAGWEVRKNEGRGVYAVAEEDGRRFLRAVSKGLGIQAARETPAWDLGTHPILVWSWRPREFPRDADERESARNDSVLAVYMGVPHSKIRGPRAMKYIWSEKVPVGASLSSNAAWAIA